jgi:hypothetical protein
MRISGMGRQLFVIGSAYWSVAGFPERPAIWSGAETAQAVNRFRGRAIFPILHANFTMSDQISA